MTRSTVLFDDACGKCSRWAAFIDRHGSGERLRTLGQETEEGRELLADRPPSMEGVDSVFIVTEDGQTEVVATTSPCESISPGLR